MLMEKYPQSNSDTIKIRNLVGGNIGYIYFIFLNWWKEGKNGRSEKCVCVFEWVCVREREREWEGSKSNQVDYVLRGKIPKTWIILADKNIYLFYPLKLVSKLAFIKHQLNWIPWTWPNLDIKLKERYYLLKESIPCLSFKLVVLYSCLLTCPQCWKAIILTTKQHSPQWAKIYRAVSLSNIVPKVCKNSPPPLKIILQGVLQNSEIHFLS